MMYGAAALAATLRRRLWRQLAATALIALFFAFDSGLNGWVAAAYGGTIAIVSTLLQQWHLRRMEACDPRSSARALRFLYRAALERLAAVAILFALALGLLQLAPLALLVAFTIGQAALLIDGIQFKDVR